MASINYWPEMDNEALKKMDINRSLCGALKVQPQTEKKYELKLDINCKYMSALLS